MKNFEKIMEVLTLSERPSLYLPPLLTDDAFVSLRGCEQSPIHHPEGDVLTHTLMVVDEAVRLKSFTDEKEVLMLSALLHDIGKPATTKKSGGKITTYDHHKEGVQLTKKLLKEVDFKQKEKVQWLVRHHMRLRFYQRDNASNALRKFLRKTDLEDFLLLRLLTQADDLGRGI